MNIEHSEELIVDAGHGEEEGNGIENSTLEESHSHETSETEQYFVQSIQSIEKELNLIISQMQTDLEQIFEQLVNSIIEQVQESTSEIQQHVQEIREKTEERKEVASNLEHAERAITSFYQSIDGVKL